MQWQQQIKQQRTHKAIQQEKQSMIDPRCRVSVLSTPPDFTQHQLVGNGSDRRRVGSLDQNLRSTQDVTLWSSLKRLGRSDSPTHLWLGTQRQKQRTTKKVGSRPKKSITLTTEQNFKIFKPTRLMMTARRSHRWHHSFSLFLKQHDLQQSKHGTDSEDFCHSLLKNFLHVPDFDEKIDGKHFGAVSNEQIKCNFDQSQPWSVETNTVDFVKCEICQSCGTLMSWKNEFAHWQVKKSHAMCSEKEQHKNSKLLHLANSPLSMTQLHKHSQWNF